MDEGAPTPLGVHLVEGGANIAIPAPGATAIDLCLFDAAGERETARWRLPGRTGDVFHGFAPALTEGARYGLRALGPTEQHFDPAKLLLDPWARAIDRPFALAPAMFEPGADTAAAMPKAVLAAMLPPVAPPRITGGRVVYELHVRGSTRTHPAIPEAIRGTFAGLAHPAAIAHLRRLGITHVELMPCAAWVDERHLPPLGLTNYWGYNTVGWLAPDPRLAPGGMADVRAAVAALAEAGIGTILDIVLNHSGEGDEHGPTLSLRGLGDAAWYRTRPGAPGRYANETGCGNSLALDHPWPLRLAMDAMRHWVSQAGLAGLRLDLATTLGRRAGGFDPLAPLLQAMRQDPLLADRWIIAEPWDVGHGGYRLGAFPPGWGEWNDRFRDETRRFWRGDAGSLGGFATRFAGSRDVFGTRPATESVNFVTSHDGFTLADLVSHARKHNAANGEGNRDGAGENLSWNNGVEGATDDPAILARRKADVRALLATLLAARGTPMLSMGDEAGRSQQGNNNAWCQDDALSWFDWTAADDALVEFTARLVAARRRHPALASAAPLTGAVDAGSDADVRWLRLDGGPMTDGDWMHPGARSVVALFHAAGDRVLVVLHGDQTEATLHLPPPRAGHCWTLIADSADPAREGEVRGPLPLAPRSVAWCAEAPSAPRAATAPDTALLAELAAAAGIATAWHDIAGTRHAVPEGTLRALLGALDLPAETAIQARDSLARRRATRRATAPTIGHCAPPPEGRRFGVVAQTFALRHAADQGIGDYGALARLAAAAGVRGAALIGLSPPHALMPVERERASPYQPSDRRFLEPVLLDVTALPDVGGAPAVRAALAAAEPVFAALRGGALVDYPSVWTAKRGVLEAAFRALPADHAALRALDDSALADFCTFAALADRHGPRGAWPSGLAHPADLAVARFRAEQADAIRFHSALQWFCDRQLAAAAAAGPGLYRDLAVGAAPDGAETWSQPGAFLDGFSIGAPPDPFSAEGQVWGLPVPNPHASEASGHAGFAALLAANMRHARAMRLDHAMGLERLFVVPAGARASEGCYLHGDGAGMLATLARESRAAGCAVVGEALGTVPEGFTDRLSAAGVLAYRVLWFERDGTGFRDPRTWPASAAACVSTHDLAPLAGWWEGAEIAERAALGLAAAEPALQDRARDRAALCAACGISDRPYGPQAAAAVHGFVAAAPSALMLVQAEDLAGERIGVNLPGTDRERPNWRRRLPVAADALFEGDLPRAILGALRERGADDGGPPRM
ncbi:glycogen debranching protein GlgX [Neoroseomonas oryzicola]|uniref:4-alpha-glucanotransferase n=1 Tax=Neoroseomonas oryzicola TaxID=535904 RepID=A0A9X9WBZ9_9PROT|nr:glycogen debranching protein GlgX [Neoroseomonas oryzicola]MBR0657859.1 glycogen debranching protein GlgX [Neoroseomonas oryzicola]NKE18573.1 glycogen debranching protein GlgX [Neoroseomonas oryzicola]